jgi:hypothetical protein
MGINSKEIKYISYAIIFAIIWFVFLMPSLLKGGIESSSPYLQFFIFNIGLFLFLQIFLKAATLKQKVNWRVTLGLLIMFMAIDILVPPFGIDVQGNLSNVSNSLMQSGSDYMIGYFAVNNLGMVGSFTIPSFITSIINILLNLINLITSGLFHINVSPLLEPFTIAYSYLFTYILVPGILLIIAALIIPNFVEKL